MKISNTDFGFNSGKHTIISILSLFMDLYNALNAHFFGNHLSKAEKNSLLVNVSLDRRILGRAKRKWRQAFRAGDGVVVRGDGVEVHSCAN